MPLESSMVISPRSITNRWSPAATLQYVAGQDNINTTTRYVHPREAAVQKLFLRLEDLRPKERVACAKSVQLEMPSPDELAKILNTGNLQSAEVVELADTPS
jgi:hypothetical protein